MTSETMLEHEVKFIQSFVIEEKQQRWQEALRNLKKRDTFLTRLADRRDFSVKKFHKIGTSPRDPESIKNLLGTMGAKSLCYCISQIPDFDGRCFHLEEALSHCIGLGRGSVISCLPGQLAFYEGEMPDHRGIFRNA